MTPNFREKNVLSKVIFVLKLIQTYAWFPVGHGFNFIVKFLP